MEDKNNKNNQVEIDTEIYERLAIIGMKLGRDNVIYYQLRKEREKEED